MKSEMKLFEMEQAVLLTKALADESRLRVLFWLREGEMCLCQIVAMLDLAPSTVSRHMTVLVQSGLVTSRKDGRWMFYQLAGRHSAVEIRETLKWLKKIFVDQSQLQNDLKKLRQIRQQDPSELCEITYTK